MEGIFQTPTIFTIAAASATFYLVREKWKRESAQSAALRQVSTTASKVVKGKRRAAEQALPSFCTNAIHGGQPADPSTGGVCVPINLSTTFAQKDIGVPPGRDHYAGYDKGFAYARGANPTRNSFELCIKELEFGANYCCAYGSGMSALAAVVHLG